MSTSFITVEIGGAIKNDSGGGGRRHFSLNGNLLGVKIGI